MTPEQKTPGVDMPYEGNYSQEDFAQQMIDEYKAARVHPRNVFPQSFNIEDVRYWIKNTPWYGKRAVYLDDANTPAELPSFSDLQSYADEGINIVGPPMWALLTVDDNRIAPSTYALEARKAGLDIITWTLERSGPLKTGGGWYYQTVTEVIGKDGDMFTVLEVLARDVGILGIFSDWPATVTYYANCMGLK